MRPSSLSALARRRHARGQSIDVIAVALVMRPADVRRALARRATQGRPPLPPGQRKVPVYVTPAQAAELKAQRLR
jgi:hypothetical protein